MACTIVSRLTAEEENDNDMDSWQLAFLAIYSVITMQFWLLFWELFKEMNIRVYSEISVTDLLSIWIPIDNVFANISIPNNTFMISSTLYSSRTIYAFVSYIINGPNNGSAPRHYPNPCWLLSWAEPRRLSFHLCWFVSVSVSLFIWLLATLREDTTTNFDEIFRICWARYNNNNNLKNSEVGMVNLLHTRFLYICFLGKPSL